MPLLRVPSYRFVSLADLVDGRRRYFRARAPPDTLRPFTSATEIGINTRRITMGAYCTLDSIRRHPARLGEIMEVRRISTYYDVAVFGDRGEIACIPHKGCLLEVVASGEATHPEVNHLLPGQVIRYTRSFFFFDRFELPSGTKVGLPQLVGFKLQLAPSRRAPLPEEDAVVRRVMREKLDVAETVTGTAVASPG